MRPSHATEDLPSAEMPMPSLRNALLLALLVLVPACTPERSVNATSPDAYDWTLRAERTDFAETARYDEVVAYLEQAAAVHPELHLTWFGYTNEGRALPLLVAGPVEDGSPESVRAASAERGLPVLYLQGNIHSGEAAGKEALLRLVRDMAHGERPELFDDLILLIGPIYNADGNERVELGNRPRQHGPIGGMGTRPNAQGLDLNRDQMKLDAPEARSLARLMTEWDPHVLVDLHTTNGTRHAYHLTYSPPLHPATPSSIDDLLRDGFFPEATRNFEETHGWHIWHYGNVSTRGGERGWYTFDHRPRFVTNYTGLRNRIGILSEAYSYLTFEDRILASERFVEEILAWSRANGERIVRVVRDEDARDLRGSRIAVRGGFPERGSEHPILMGAVEEEPHPFTGQTILRRIEVVETDPMPAFVHFVGTEEETVPYAYLLPAELSPVVERLRAHGVRVESGEAGVALDVGPDGAPAGGFQRFRIDGMAVSEQPFQGRNEVVLEGAWGAIEAGEALEPGTSLAEWYVVPMDQPRARLAFLLLEPRADDGFLNWGILDSWLEEGEDYPIRRVVGGG